MKLRGLMVALFFIGGSAWGALSLKSLAFAPGGAIPRSFTGDGADHSPPLSWSGAPSHTKEFALIVEDPDAPQATPWVHWVAYGIPGAQSELRESAAVKSGLNSFGSTGYRGPSPPPGKPHRYFFRLYALDRSLALPEGGGKEQLLGAMKGHVLAQAELVGKYGR